MRAGMPGREEGKNQESEDDMKIDELASQLGMTPEEIANRIINQVVDDLLRRKSEDDEGGYRYDASSDFANMLREQIEKTIREKIDLIATEHMGPQVEGFLRTLVFKPTNRYGDRTGADMTITEHIAAECERWIAEPVNFQGQSKAESQDGYSFKGETTRLGHLIHKHIHYSIEQVMRDAIQRANVTLVKSLEETAKIQLAKIAETLSVSVKVKGS